MDSKESVLSAKCAVIIGCGGLGCNVSVHLAGMGIGRLILVDFDRVEQSNLNRQFLYTSADVGGSKCDLLAARLRAYAPRCTIECCNRKVTCTDDLSFAQDADILISAVDGNAVRRVLSDYCTQQKKPLVNGGVNGMYGTAYLYVPGVSADLDRAGLLDAENGSVRAVSSTVGVIGALQAQLAAKCLCGDCSQAGKLLIFDREEIHSMHIRYKE
ncbi:MAG: ThiF family adenylyltransferase [Clostridia bacterium]|nr:ThiF family adenylyltransferase [Clostridia bacterium]